MQCVFVTVDTQLQAASRIALLRLKIAVGRVNTLSLYQMTALIFFNVDQQLTM